MNGHPANHRQFMVYKLWNVHVFCAKSRPYYFMGDFNLPSAQRPWVQGNQALKDPGYFPGVAKRPKTLGTRWPSA